MEQLCLDYNCVFSYTITPYGTDMEPFVPDVATSIRQLQELSNRVGKKRVTWRYDPILLNEKYTLEFHKMHFGYIAELVAPYVADCGFNLVNMYEKTKRNAPDIRRPTQEESVELLASMGATAKKYHLYVKACPQSGYEKYGFECAPCMSLKRLEEMTGVEMKQVKGYHDCMMCSNVGVRDLGCYESCGNGCRYCYATWNHEFGARLAEKYDINSPMLLDKLRGDEQVSVAKLRKYRA